MNKRYYAFISFGHNGVNIKGGTVFDAADVNFSKVDIDFLRSQQKIVTESEYISRFKPAEKSVSEPVIATPVVEEPVTIVPEPIVEEPVPVVSEAVIEEPVTIVPEPIVEEPVIETVEETIPSDDRITVEINESELINMKKADLVELAKRFDITGAARMTKEDLVAKISELNS